MTQKDFVAFAKAHLKIEFKNIDLLITALTHRSYINEHKTSAKEHNERLEFLGDAVLELVVTEHLYLNFSEPEGILTNWRSALVRTESLSEAAANLDIYEFLRLSRGEKQGSDRAKQQILANAFEAVIGAIYLDQGYKVAAKFISDHILSTLDGILESGSWKDPKSHLQELAQSNDNSTPVYKVIKEEGPDHDKIFVVGVYINEKLSGKGEGSSKQIAQQSAAKIALKKYNQAAA